MVSAYIFAAMDVNKWTIFSLLDSSFVSKIQMAYVFGNLGNEALIVTRDDEVFAMGSNCAGCLGVGDLQNVLHPKKIGLDTLSGKKVVGNSYCFITLISPILKR